MGSSKPEILGAYLTERLSVYDCPESCGADFSGPCGVAQSARVGAGGLLVHGGLPENGNLRLGATNATSSSLGSGQHRRRISSAWESGQSTLYEYGRGFAGGESLLLDPGERRSEERRVGKECKCRWAQDQYKKRERRKR